MSDMQIWTATDKRTRQVFSLKFLWGTSRGRDTYGYTTCSIMVDGKRRANCNGGGYDMKGTVFADWLEQDFMDRLKRLNTKDPNDRELYGLKHWDAKTLKRRKTGMGKGVKTNLDGACGFSQMERIARKIGITLKYISD